MIPPLPELVSADVDLIRRRVLGGPGDHLVSGQISIGRSEAVRLGPASPGLDAELARKLAQDDEQHHYYLVLLSCTFRAGSAPVVGARLSVALRQADVTGVREPVVWSMDPLRASTSVTYRRTLRIGPNVKILPIDTTIERTKEFPADKHYLVAEGEGESQVEWAFTATHTVDLVGVHHLSLVARTSARVSCRAELALAAIRQEKKFGLVPYRATIPTRIGTIRFAGR